jgi:hypothetical protein
MAGSAAILLGGLLAWGTLDVARAGDAPAPSVESTGAKATPGTTSPTQITPTPTSTSQASSCAALSALDAKWVALSEAQLEKRIRRASPLPPSMADSQLEGIDRALAAYRPSERACMRKAMLIHSLVSLQGLTGPGGRLWYYGHPSATLKAHFLKSRLATALPADDRRDAVAFIEGEMIPALQSSGEADREHWRRMYYGMLLACHADDTLLQQLGGRRQDQGCIDVASLAKATRSMRAATGVLDPWTPSKPPKSAKPKAPKDPFGSAPQKTPPKGTGVIDPWTSPSPRPQHPAPEPSSTIVDPFQGRR